ncbi:MAG: hypothetical protein KDA84_30090, partial [Planctomycetaceae bacterium]|nr:hypothetical protein [Planctomycetaceae bacterium]
WQSAIYQLGINIGQQIDETAGARRIDKHFGDGKWIDHRILVREGLKLSNHVTEIESRIWNLIQIPTSTVTLHEPFTNEVANPSQDPNPVFFANLLRFHV